MLFYPNLCDTPHKFLPFGVYTFVLHPSFITDEQIKLLEEFINKNTKYFIDFNEVDCNINKTRKRSFGDKCIEHIISGFRALRKSLSK